MQNTQSRLTPEYPNAGFPKLVLELLLLFGLLYSLNLGGRSFWTANEGFFAMAARSVLDGHVLLPEVYDGVPFDKPPLFVWWLAAVSAMLGTLSEWTVRFANILTSLVVLAGTYAFAQRWFNPWTGLMAVVITGTSYEFWQQSTQAATDPMLTAFLLLAWAALFALFVDGFTWARWATLWGCVGLAVMTKGPVAIALTGLVAGPFALWRHGLREGWRQLLGLRPFLGLVCAAAPFAVWCMAILLTMGWEPVDLVLIRHNFTRFLDAFNHVRAWWYYAPELLMNMLPWTLLLPWVIWRLVRSRRERSPLQRDAIAFAVCVVAAVFLFFSASSSKRDYYILPLTPWLSMLIAAAIWDRVRGSLRASETSEVADLPSFVSALTGWRAGRVLACTVLATITGYTVFSAVVTRQMERDKSPHDFVLAVNAAVDGNDRLFVVGRRDPRLLYYLNNDFQTDDDKRDNLAAVREVLTRGEEVDILIEVDDLNDLRPLKGVDLFLESMISFRDHQYVILTSESRAGWRPLPDPSGWGRRGLNLNKLLSVSP